MPSPRKSGPASVPITRDSRVRLRSRDWPRAPRRDPHARLIAQLLELAGSSSSVLATSTRPWASATFVGAKHRIVIVLKEPDRVAMAKMLERTLPDTEFSIRGHMVADALVDAWEVRETEGECTVLVRISALTIEDW